MTTEVSVPDATVADVTSAMRDAVGVDPEAYRAELTRYCYRMLGCPADAQDAVQETMLRAWRSSQGFQGRASVRTWLYRIATNVCIDAQRSGSRRATPMDLGPAGHPVLQELGNSLPDTEWVLPMPTPQLGCVDPAQLSVERDTVRLAFIAALQFLPPRQRAVLILCEVLRYSAAEVAELLDVSTGSVTSALQRARMTLAARPPEAPAELTRDLAGLLSRYVAAFERYDVDALVVLMREDVVMNMPPYPLWLRGPADVAAWLRGPGSECRGSRLLPTSANGHPAFGQYRPASGGGHAAWALVVLELRGNLIATTTSFLDTPTLFPQFGLPLTLP